LVLTRILAVVLAGSPASAAASGPRTTPCNAVSAATMALEALAVVLAGSPATALACFARR
jgi:hypothetical protein